jgi:hypothetical protein
MAKANGFDCILVIASFTGRAKRLLNPCTFCPWYHSLAYQNSALGGGKI